MAGRAYTARRAAEGRADPRRGQREPRCVCVWWRAVLRLGTLERRLSGHRRRRECIEQLKRGLTFTKLSRNGRCPEGSPTFYRLRRCADPKNPEGSGRCSAHFKFREFSHGNGVVRVDRLPVKFLERYRAKVGHGFSPVRPYRDPSHNRAVKGAPLLVAHRCLRPRGGRAADLAPELSVRQVEAIDKDNVIGGIGHVRSNGLVRDVDTGPERRWSTPDEPRLEAA